MFHFKELRYSGVFQKENSDSMANLKGYSVLAEMRKVGVL